MRWTYLLQMLKFTTPGSPLQYAHSTCFFGGPPTLAEKKDSIGFKCSHNISLSDWMLALTA